MQALENDMLMRGAITEVRLLHEGNSVIGEVLDEAVKLEEKSAIYPRVIVSDKEILLKIPKFNIL